MYLKQIWSLCCNTFGRHKRKKWQFWSHVEVEFELVRRRNEIRCKVALGETQNFKEIWHFLAFFLYISACKKFFGRGRGLSNKGGITVSFQTETQNFLWLGSPSATCGHFHHVYLSASTLQISNCNILPTNQALPNLG